MSDDNVIPFRRVPQVEGVIGSDRVHPELVLDPATDRYSIVFDGIEVYTGLDPIGVRKALGGTPVVEGKRWPRGVPTQPSSQEGEPK